MIITLAASYWSLWIRVPAYIVGGVVLCIIGLYGFSILRERESERVDIFIGCVLAFFAAPLIILPTLGKISFLARIVGVLVYWISGLLGCSSIFRENEHKENPKYPNWVAYLLLAFVVFATPAYMAAWNEKRVIVAFVKWFLAYTLSCYGGLVGGVATGYFAGNKVYKKYSRKWLAWCVGILIGTAVAFTITGIGSKIPGIGWRIERMEQIAEQIKDADYDHY